MTDDVARIAARLTLAQRNALLDFGSSYRVSPSPIHARVCRALIAANLLRRASKPTDAEYELTPLGAEVRSHIHKEKGEC